MKGNKLYLLKSKNARWPKLDTIIMIENTIMKKEWKSKRELWLKLPKKVMWQTFLLALDYLKNSGKIEILDNKINWKHSILEEKKDIGDNLIAKEMKKEIPSYVY